MLSTVFQDVHTSWDWMSREMNRLFESARAMDQWAPRLGVAVAAPWPGVNLWRDGDNIVAEAEIPGFRSEGIELLATGNSLTIRGNRETAPPEGATVLRLERSRSSFERTLALPVEIDADATRAELTSGVLRVTMPIAEAARPRHIEVTTADAPALPATSAEPAGASS